jgi:hypothetical protein
MSARVFFPPISTDLLDDSWKDNLKFIVPKSQPIPHVTNGQNKFTDGIVRPTPNNATVAGYNAARNQCP